LREPLALQDDIVAVATASDRTPSVIESAARLVDAGYAPAIDAVFARARAEYAEEMEREALKKRSLSGGTRGWPSGPRWRRPRPPR
jgi:hypothetical protein